jgi:hypothetical protein
MKTFVGRIVTVPDGAGRSVTVSKWGVAQSSRHRDIDVPGCVGLRGTPYGEETWTLGGDVLKKTIVEGS